MSSVVAAIVGIPIMIGIGWLVWYVWNNNRLLDKKLANGDLELLDSTSYKVTEVIRAPAGSRVEKIALQPMAVDMSGYVRKSQARIVGVLLYWISSLVALFLLLEED